MTPLGYVLSFLGIAFTGTVTYLLGFRKSGAEAGKLKAEAQSIAVETANKAVAGVQSELERINGEVRDLRARVAECDRERHLQDAKVAQLEYENASLRLRVQHLEGVLAARNGDGK